MGNRIQTGDILLDKYRVERLLGEGGMAVVVAARHIQLEQTVAIKTMSKRALRFNDAVERFVREAQTAVRLTSENVARVMDVGTLADGLPYMIMEYLEGVDLATVLRQRSALAVEDAVDFIVQACAAMHEAHAMGIVHRDLKPGNLFLTRRANGTALIKVLDFGISKVSSDGQREDQTLTNEFGTMGSPPYMSPEQARSAKRVDARTDIWSLGVLLYQLTTGQLPFNADNSAEILAMVMYEEPELASDVAPWVPGRVARIIARCLEKNTSDRFQSVAELATALVRHASAEGRRHWEQNFSSLVPRRGAARFPSFGEDDTHVESSIIIDAPEPLLLTDFLDQVPEVAERPRSFGTTQAANGELAELTISDRRRSRARLVVAALGLLVLGVAAAGIVVLTGSKDTRLEGEATPSKSATVPVDDPASATGAGDGIDGADERSIPGTKRPENDGDAGVPAVLGSTDDGAGTADDTVDDGAGILGPADGTPPDETGDKAQKGKKTGKKTGRKTGKKSGRKKGKKKKKKTGKGGEPDPFGTME